MAGSTSTSISCQSSGDLRRAARRVDARPRTHRPREYFAPLSRIVRITGRIESGLLARKSPNSANRSATHGPWYSSSPAARNGPNGARHGAVEVLFDPRPGRQVGGPHRLVTEELEFADIRQSDAEVLGITDVSPPQPGVRDLARRSRRPRRRRSARSGTVPAIRLMQSSERHAGTRPTVLIRPRDGLNPAIPLSAGGTRPDPAVSVATVNGTSPVATASADPELDPPEIRSAAEDAARQRIRRPGTVQAGGELVEIGLADEDRTGLDQPRTPPVRSRSAVGVVRAGQGGRQPRRRRCCP